MRTDDNIANERQEGQWTKLSPAAALLALVDKLVAAVEGMNATLDRMEERLRGITAEMDKMSEEIAHLETRVAALEEERDNFMAEARALIAKTVADLFVRHAAADALWQNEAQKSPRLRPPF